MKDHRRSSAVAPAAPGPVASPTPDIGRFGNSYGLTLIQCAESDQDVGPSFVDCGFESEPLESSIRPEPRPASWMESSPRPVARPVEGAMESSLRPRPRPEELGAEASGGAMETSPRPKARPDVDVAATGEAEVVEHPMAGMLEVLPADYEGERLPHQVTQEEYDATLALYDQIASGESNIKLEAGMQEGMTEEEFQDAVMKDFAKILTTEQGRGLIGELAGSEDGLDHEVVIGALAEDEVGEATAVDARYLPTDPALAEYMGELLVGGHYGTDALVEYAPDTVQDFTKGAAPGQEWAEMDSSTTLYHELIHAWEIHKGTLDGEEVGEAAVAPHEDEIRVDEYEAVGLGGMGGEYTENGYRAERAAVTGEDIPQRDAYAVVAE